MSDKEKVGIAALYLSVVTVRRRHIRGEHLIWSRSGSYHSFSTSCVQIQKGKHTFCWSPLDPLQGPSGILRPRMSLNYRYWARKWRNSRGACFPAMALLPLYVAPDSSLQVHKRTDSRHCFKCRTWKASDSVLMRPLRDLRHWGNLG